MTDLLVIVPTRSRPEAVSRVVAAWQETGAFDDGGELLFVIDEDDPRYAEYIVAFYEVGNSLGAESCGQTSIQTWMPLVPKLNAVALVEATDHPRPYAIGFAGDDHLPRTPGWARRYVDTLRAAGTGIVYCDDGYQHENIPTQWAMTADIVRALGGMVPAPVDHLYCDNVVRDIGKAADCLYYLPDVLIEHMHPVVGKAPSDEQYERVNGRQQYRNDRPAYRSWRDGSGLIDAACAVRELIEGKAA